MSSWIVFRRCGSAAPQRKSEFRGGTTWASAKDLAQRFRGEDRDGYRAELVRLIELAAALEAQNMTSPQSRR